MAPKGEGRLHLDKEKIGEWARTHRTELIVGGVLIVVLIIAVMVWFQTTGKEEPTDVISQNEAGYTVLPETRRTLDDREPQLPDLADPFAGPVMLKGIIKGGNDEDLAIIEAGNQSYVVAPHDQLGDHWIVEEIQSDKVILKSEKEKMELRFAGRTRTIQLEDQQPTGRDENDE
jgi:hypothetical protein